MGNFDQYFPFDKGFGAPASAALWGKMAAQFSPDGVISAYNNQMGATITGGNITIQTGAAMVHGYYGEVQNPQSFPVGTNGMVVAAVDMSAEVMSIYYKDGVTDYSSSPGLIQTSTLWEIPLWLVSGTTPVDRRSFVSPGRGLGAAASASIGAYIAMTSGTPYQFNVGTFNFSHPAWVMFTWQAQFRLASASLGADVIWYGTYQYGLPDQQGSYSYEWTWPGGVTGIYGNVYTIQWPLSVTPGRKSIGIHVSPTGSVSIANMMVSAIQLGTVPNA